MAEFQSSPGKYPDSVVELQSEVNHGLLALAEYLHRAWGLPGSVQDLQLETGPGSCPQEHIEDFGADLRELERAGVPKHGPSK